MMHKTESSFLSFFQTQGSHTHLLMYNLMLLQFNVTLSSSPERESLLSPLLAKICVFSTAKLSSLEVTSNERPLTNNRRPKQVR